MQPLAASSQKLTFLHMYIFNVLEVFELNHLGLLHKEVCRSEVSF